MSTLWNSLMGGKTARPRMRHARTESRVVRPEIHKQVECQRVLEDDKTDSLPETETAVTEPDAHATTMTMGNLDKMSETMDQTIVNEGEDYLLSQIDEFRARAQQLQILLKDKESKAQELQQLVQERQEKAEELEAIVEERQGYADGFTKQVEAKLDTLIEKVNTRLDEVGATVANEIADHRAKEEAKLEEVQERFSTELATVKTELAEKTHSECVQSYRNMSELVKNVEQRMDKLDELDRKLGKLKGITVGLVVFGLLNLAGVVAAVLLNLGVFAL